MDFIFDPSRFGFSEAIVTLAGPSGQQLCEGNPNRVLLCLSPDSATFLRITTGGDPAVAHGWSNSSIGMPIQFTWAQHGPLVTLPWFTNGMILATITVFEVWLLPRG